jgi:hypothetical protein
MDTVQNLSAGVVTIKKTNSTITNGNDPEILDYVPTLLDIRNLYDGSIAIFDNTGTRRYYQNAPADNIIVLEKGKVIEQGTHNSLVSSKGAYYNLVKNQLELGN